MKTEEIKSIKIEFEGDESDYKKIGFGQVLNADEKEILKNLDEKINK